MSHAAVISLRVAIVSTGVTACTFAVLWFSNGLSAATHGWIMGTGAVLFAVSEGFFVRLLNELNGVLRFTGYSVWQLERLRQVILPFKKKAWLLWTFSQALKAASGLCAVLLQKQTLSVTGADKLLWIGYSCLFLALCCTAWTVSNFLRVEKFRDELAREEVSIKERKRLSSELGAGDSHNFQADAQIQDYSKPAEPI